MHYLQIDIRNTYKIAILTKTNALNKEEFQKYYINPMIQQGVPQENFVGFSVEYDNPKKPTAKFGKEYLTTELLPELDKLEVEYIYCTDGNYFKFLTGVTKVAPYYGSVLPCKLKGYEHFNVVLSANYKGLFANDSLIEKIDLANKTLSSSFIGSFRELGSDIIHYYKPVFNDLNQLKEELNKLLNFPALTCDVEAFALHHHKAGLGTIAFAWNKHEGISIDVSHLTKTTNSPNISNQVCLLLKEFFIKYTGTLIFHNATYDIKILIYKLWMNGLTDTQGLIDGLQVLTRNFEDTKIIAYLATNSCAGNHLSLKELAHEYTGNYAEDNINDITLIESSQLLKYNCVDCLATWFVKEKYEPMMINDNQSEVYIFFKKILKNIIQKELTGLPVDLVRVKEVKNIIQNIVDQNQEIVNNSTIIKDFSEIEKEERLAIRNSKLKTKVLRLEDIDYTFNVNSNKQLVKLIHEFIGFEVYSFTQTKQPAVGKDEIKGHIKRTENKQVIELLEAILKIQEGEKIINTFLSKFEEAARGDDGWHYLFGSLVLGGTKSGRLSSRDPNLQNLPSGSTYGKLVKSCFRGAPGIVEISNFDSIPATTPEIRQILLRIEALIEGNKILANNREKFNIEYAKLVELTNNKYLDVFTIHTGWIFCGLDYASLEDRINTLLTKDKNKIRVYTDHFDGHSLRCASYFPNDVPEITTKLLELQNKNQKFYKVIQDNGTIEYMSQSELDKQSK